MDGRSTSLVFLHDDDEDRIARELVKLLQAEEYGRGSRQRFEVGYLTTGAASWSLLRPEPPGLLADRVPGRDRPRLADLACRLACDAFHFELREDGSSAVLEAGAGGAFLYTGTDPDRERFSLIGVPDNLRYIVDDVEDVETVPERMARALGVDQNAVEDETADTIVVWYTPPRSPGEPTAEPGGSPNRARPGPGARGRRKGGRAR